MHDSCPICRNYLDVKRNKQLYLTMDPAVQRAIAEGIITAVVGTNNFRCSLCPGTYSGDVPARQHLGGREHANNGAAYILAHPSDKRQSLRKLVSVRLLAAAERNEVRGMRCRICGLDFQGAAPLEQHVAGSNHAKKCRAAGIPEGAAATARAGVQQVQPTISPLAAHYDSNGPIECGLCKVQCTGKQSYDQHVKGDKHRKKALALGLQIGASVSITPKTISPLAAHYDSNGPIECGLCKVQCTGKQSYDEHLKGDKHRKKAMALDLEMRAKKATSAFAVPAASTKPLVQATSAFAVPAASTKPLVQATSAFAVPAASTKPLVQATSAFAVPAASTKPLVQATSAFAVPAASTKPVVQATSAFAVPAASTKPLVQATSAFAVPTASTKPLVQVRAISYPTSTYG
ncbi:zinc finger matrin-type protein 4-like [Penaeus indicus]|uniref:zinc finger matrin-type protein 4-like n=1 Tax=Penaeus indicus TaxID=29960 RepID=UPI00300D97CF